MPKRGLQVTTVCVRADQSDPPLTQFRFKNANTVTIKTLHSNLYNETSLTNA